MGVIVEASFVNVKKKVRKFKFLIKLKLKQNVTNIKTNKQTKTTTMDKRSAFGRIEKLKKRKKKYKTCIRFSP